MPTSTRRHRRRPVRAIAAAVVVVLAVCVSVAGGPTPTAVAVTVADGCYRWPRTLRAGTRGDDVRRLQTRVSGYPGFGAQLRIDGDYGPATRGAVSRFQRAYGLQADGVAGPRTLATIARLQDDDCTPRHFSFNEMDVGCGRRGFGGGLISASGARSAALVTMWKLEALRHALGDRSITVASGFRSQPCNRLAGGAPRSHHLFGDAADLDAGPHSLCRLALQARFHGFGGIYGPGYPGHDAHVHVDGGGSTWRASRCGI